MATFKINIGGMEITANSATDVADLVRAMGSAKAQEPQKQEQRPARQAPVEEQQTAATRHRDLALTFLGEIASNPKVSSTRMQEVLGVREAKGIGSRTGQINGVIADLGFKQEDVYLTQREGTGRAWMPGPRISDAIKAVKNAS